MIERDFSYYIKEAKKLEAEHHDLVDIKVALLSNFTIRGLKEVLKVKCDEIAVNCELYEADYNQIYQEILDPNSGLKNFNPNITYLLISPQYIFGDSFIKIIKEKEERTEFIENKTKEFIQIIDNFLNNISGILIVSNLKQFSYSPLGIVEEKINMSKKDMIVYFNNKLKSEYIKNNQVYIYDFNSFFIKYGENSIINHKLRYLGDFFISTDFLPKLGDELMGFIKPFTSKNKKCIILDLDNTLWGGIIGEDGFNNIKLDNKAPGNSYFEFQKYLLALNERGIMLAINSQNNAEDALKVIRKHPYMVLKEENFSSIKINWENKVNNIIDIAKELNIGTDSLVFIDDDPFNRSLVKKLLPEVLVVDLPNDSSLYVETLKKMTDFNTLQLTEEDFKRIEMYNHQHKRIELRDKINNLDDFLNQLEIKTEIKKADDFTIARISQLTKKTNQFNLTTRRYSEEDIKKFSESTEYLVYSVHVKDKFGDNGLTGVFIIHKKSKSEWVIDTFLMSCRILGRKIENIMLNTIIGLAKKENVSKIIGEFFLTNKNSIVKEFYIKNNFKKINDSTYILDDFNLLKELGE